MISGFVTHAGGKTCTALIIWQGRACLEMFVGFESCWTYWSNASVFIFPPDVRSGHPSAALEDFTLREFVQLAMHRAEPQSRRMPGLGEVLRILKDREMWEAEQFALRITDEQDEQTRRASSGQA